MEELRETAHETAPQSKRQLDTGMECLEFCQPCPDRNADYQADVAMQPHLKWFDGIKRGYVSCTLDRKSWKSDYIQIDTVKKPYSAVDIGSSWVIEDGRLGVQRA